MQELLNKIVCGDCIGTLSEIAYGMIYGKRIIGLGTWEIKGAIPAATPEEAISLCKDKATVIDLLLTDVVMPGMSGKELKKEIEAIRPGIKVLFMSGYTSNVIAHRGVLEKGVHFIQKPFSMKDLAQKVREVIGER